MISGRKLIGLVSIVGLITILAGARPGCAEDGTPKRLFFVSFDNHDTRADEAAGNPKSNFEGSLLLRLPEGAYSAGGMRLEPGETCEYDLKGNLDMRRGSIAFWVKPYNWDETPSVSQLHFFCVTGEDGRSHIAIHKAEHSKNLYFAITWADPASGTSRAFGIPTDISSWKKGQWHKIDAVWDSIGLHKMWLYVDGVLKGTSPLLEEVPVSTKGKISLVPYAFWKGHASTNYDLSSFVDEVEVWVDPLPESAIMERYRKTVGFAAVSYEFPKVVVPRVRGPVEVDGVLNEPLWREASLVPIAIELGLGSPYPRKAFARLAYDEQNLYLGLTTDTSGGLKRKITAHDGPVWEDDVFEVHLNPPGNAGPAFYYHFIVNADNTLWDGKNYDSAVWNPTITVKSFVGNGLWTAEMAIPWNQLDGRSMPQPGDIWKATFSRTYVEDTVHAVSWSFMGMTYNDPSRFGAIVFAGPGEGIRLSDDSNWSLGQVNLGVEGPGWTSGTASVLVHASGKDIIKQDLKLGKGITPAPVRAVLQDVGAGMVSVRARRDGVNADALVYQIPNIYVKSSLEITLMPFYDRKLLHAGIAIANPPQEWADLILSGKAVAACTLVSPSQQTFKVVSPVKGQLLEVDVPVGRAWQDGKYEVCVTITHPAARKPIVARKEIVKPPLPWIGNTIGLDDGMVPSPWTPLAISGPTVTCWNRRYEMGGAFPAKMTSGGQQILTGPIVLTLTTAADTQILGRGDTVWKSIKRAKAVYAGKSPLKGGGMFRYEGSVEFDGFVLTKLTIVPPKGGLDVKSLVLDIPLDSRIAEYLRDGTGRMFVDRGSKLVPVWDGKGDYSAQWGHYLWIGNLSVGFDWSCETDADWYYGKEFQPCRVVRDGATTHMRFHIVNQPYLVREPLEYTFGFQATPVRPVREGARTLRNTSHRLYSGANFTTIGWDMVFDYITWFVPQDPPFSEELSLKHTLVETRKRGIRCLAYTCGIQTADSNPVWDFLGEYWKNPYGPVFNDLHTRKDGKVYALMPISPREWAPFQAWMADRFLAGPESDNVNGIYIDCTAPYPTRNCFNGTGYEKDAFGKSGFSYPVFGLREIFMRLLRIVRERRGPAGEFMGHAHNVMLLPIHGLADYFFPGEQYGGLVQNKPTFYMDDVPLDVYRVEMNPKPYGLVQVLCTMIGGMTSLVDRADYPKWVPNPSPEFQDIAKRWDKLYEAELVPGPTESLLAVMLLHDLPYLEHALFADSLKEIWDIEGRLKFADAGFVPYWEPNGITCLDPETRASVYTHKDSATVVIVNFKGEARPVRFEVDPGFFGWSGANLAVTDERLRSAAGVVGNTVTVQVKAKNYTVVRIAPQ